MFKPICAVSALCLAALPLKASDNFITENFASSLTFDDSSAPSKTVNEYDISYSYLAFNSSYADFTSGSCAPCASACASGYSTTAPTSSQCYGGSSSYRSCSTGDMVYCYKSLSNICASGTYPYTSKSNATMSGSCSGYRSTARGACSGSSGTYYKSYSCNSGYCDSSGSCLSCSSSCPSGYSASISGCYTGSTSYRNCTSCGSKTCYKNATVCSSSTYPYTSAPYTNSQLSGSSCTGYTGTSGGACSGSSATRYSSWTCKTNYCGSTCGTSCSSACPSGYSSTAPTSSQCATGSTSYTNCSTCGSKTCYKGVTSCSSSCPSGYSASISGCYTGSTSYINCTSCGSKTCYKNATVCSSSTYKYTSAPYTNSVLSGSSCTGYTGTSGGACSGTSATRYSSYACKSGYCGSTCSTSCSSSCPSGYSYTSIGSGYCYTGSKAYYNCSSCSQTTCYSRGTWCDTSTYKYTSAPTNGTLSGSSCTGYGGTNKGACSGSSATRYSDFTCNTNYCKSGSVCYRYYSSCSAFSSLYRDTDGKCDSTTYASTVRNSSCGYRTCYTGGYTVCDSSTYPYTTAPANATLSGSTCTGRRGTVGGSCSTSSNATYYSSFTCKSGYVKVGSACQKYYASCSAAGYSEFSSNCKSGYYKTIYLSTGSTKACCTSFCSGVTKANCSGTWTSNCTAYNGTAYGTCSTSSGYDYNGACKSSGYSYAIAQTCNWAYEADFNCGYTGGYPAKVAYNGSKYCYTCCR